MNQIGMNQEQQQKIKTLSLLKILLVEHHINTKIFYLQ
jgi:hypothetical protein